MKTPLFEARRARVEAAALLFLSGVGRARPPVNGDLSQPSHLHILCHVAAA